MFSNSSRRNLVRTAALSAAGLTAVVGISAASVATASATPTSTSTVVASHQGNASQTFMVMNRTNRTLFVALSSGSRKLTQSVPANGYWMPTDDFTGFTTVTAQDGGYVFAGSISSDGTTWSNAHIDYTALSQSTLDNHGMLVLAG